MQICRADVFSGVYFVEKKKRINKVEDLIKCP